MSNNITRTLTVEFPEDVRKLRWAIPLLDDYSNIQIDVLYRRFSETYAANWLIVNDDYIKEFTLWLEE